MARIVDITDKLNFEEKPGIKIKDTVITINNDAPSMLKVLAILEDDGGKMKPSAIQKLADLLFDEEEYAKLVALRLSIEDYTMVVFQTAAVASGWNGKDEEDAEKETETPATT